MATSAFFKVHDFVEQLCKGVHDFNADTFKIALVAADPTNAATDYALLTDLGTGNGYTAGGSALNTPTFSESNGTVTFSASPLVFTASGGTIGPFRYAVLYNDTPSAGVLTDPIVGYYDYGSSITLQDTETFTINVTTNIFTLT